MKSKNWLIFSGFILLGFALGFLLNPVYLGSQSTIWPAQLVRSGQTTSYVTGDDANLLKGYARSYTVVSAGQFSGTTNIILNHYTSGAGAITFKMSVNS